jgi:hypothetical protein
MPVDAVAPAQTLAGESFGPVGDHTGQAPIALAPFQPGQPGLLPQHIADLARSGISVEDARAAGIKSVNDPAAIAAILHWKKPANALGPCLVFSFRSADGQVVEDFARVKPDKPRVERKGANKGKPIKYESPVGKPNRSYFPQDMAPSLADPSIPVIITEGEKKALRAALAGFACIGLVGVWGWQQKRQKDGDGRGVGERKLIPDLDSVNWSGRRVYIIFDSDAAQKPEVQSAETALAEVLLQRGAEVRVVRLPEATDSDGSPVKVGVDDFLVAHPAEELQALMDAAEPFVRTAAAESSSPPGRLLVDGWELTESGYAASAGRTFLCAVERDEDGNPRIVKRTKLANFTARIVGQTVLDDGAERQRELNVVVEQLGRSPVTIEVPVERFNSLDFIVEGAGPQCVIQAGSGKRDHLRCAVQELSGNDIKTVVVYRHTGFREINGCWCYLHADGAIGPDGVICGVKVQLDGNAAHYRLPPPPTGAELVRCVRASLGTLDRLAPDEVVFPLKATEYRAPLGAADYSLWLAGHTGEGKSELLALSQQHYGAEMKRLKLPGNWSSTDNALEGMAFTVKDALFAVDDFCPAGAKHDHDRMHRVADRLIRAQGNRSARQRMRADGSLRPPKPPRGLIAATGEDVPRGHSLTARLAIVEVQRGVVNFARLSECQRDAEAGVYAAAMAGYVQWHASRHGEIQARLEAERIELRDQFLREFPHNRTPDVIANLLLGLRYLLWFAEVVGAIDAQEREALWSRGSAAFRTLGERQAEHQRAADPVARFGEMVCAVIASGRGHIAGADGKAPALPPSPEFWGWEGREFRSGSDQTAVDYRGREHKIGWVVGEELYLDPDSTFAALFEFARDQGVPFPLTQHTLYRRVKERGLFLRTEKDRTTYPVTLEGARRSVLVFSAPLLLQKPGQPGQPGQGTCKPPASVPVFCPGFSESGEKPGHQNVANRWENRSSVPVVPVVPVSSPGEGAGNSETVEAATGTLADAVAARADAESGLLDPSLSQKPGQPGQPGQTSANTGKNASVCCPGFSDPAPKPGHKTGTLSLETDPSVPPVPVVPVPTTGVGAEGLQTAPQAGSGTRGAAAGLNGNRWRATL